jgi:integrase/recombinase XerD
MGLVALAEDHLAYLESAHYSPHTIKNRRSNLRQFCRWCAERGIGRPGEVTRPVIERYRQWLFHFRQEDGRALSWASQCHKLVAVKMYLRWLARSNVLLYNPAAELEMPRPPRRIPVAVLTLPEVEQVLSQPDVREPLGVRDRAILETLYSTGMRRMEIVGLTVYDVDLERGTVMIRLGKGGKDRVVPIGERALFWIDRYLEEVRLELLVPPDDGQLFLSHRGRPFTLKGMTMLCHRLVKASGVGKAGSCHIFRHTCATLMLERGADIRFIQQMLGHEHLATTEIYTRVSIGKLKEVHTKTHPSARRGRAGAPESAPESAEELLSALAAEAAEEDDERGGDPETSDKE